MKPTPSDIKNYFHSQGVVHVGPPSFDRQPIRCPCCGEDAAAYNLEVGFIMCEKCGLRVEIEKRYAELGMERPAWLDGKRTPEPQDAKVVDSVPGRELEPLNKEISSVAQTEATLNEAVQPEDFKSAPSASKEERADGSTSNRILAPKISHTRKDDSGRMFDRDAKCAVLGAMLLESECIETAASVVGSEDFSKAHAPIFARALELFQGGKVVDPILLVGALRDHGELDAVAGPAYVCGLTDGMARGTNVRAYAEVLRQAAVRRRVYESMKKAVQHVESGDGDPAKVIERLVTELERIKQPKAAGFTPPDFWELLDVSEARDWKCNPLESVVDGIFAKGRLAFIGADSQVGKTLVMVYVALMMCRGGKLFGEFQINPLDRMCYLALEDPKDRLKMRIPDTARDGNLGEPRKFMMYLAVTLSLSDPLALDWLETFIEDGKYQALVIDTFQKCSPGISSWDDEKLGPLIQRLMGITRRLNVLIIILDHVSKGTAAARRKKSTLTLSDFLDIKGSRIKVQNADAVLAMDRQDKDTLIVQVGGKDRGSGNLSFLLGVSPEGAEGPKFIYKGTVESVAAKSREKGERTRQR